MSINSEASAQATVYGARGCLPLASHLNNAVHVIHTKNAVIVAGSTNGISQRSSENDCAFIVCCWTAEAGKIPIAIGNRITFPDCLDQAGSISIYQDLIVILSRLCACSAPVRA